MQSALESSEIPDTGDPKSPYRTEISLKDIVHVEVYTHPLEEGARCSGLLVRHSDGRQEALGQRRVGLPDIQTTSVSRPSQMHYRRFKNSNGHWRVNIMFSTNGSPRVVDVDQG